MNIEKFIAEMAVHTPLCVLNDPKNVAMISGSDQMKTELKKHNLNLSDQADDLDVIIDLSGSGEVQSDKLNDRGIIFKSFSSLDEIKKLNFDGFRYVYLPSFSSLISTENLMGFVFASKYHHPTAELIIQKADMLENCDYYSEDMHKASFALPKAVKEELKGTLKL